MCWQKNVSEDLRTHADTLSYCSSLTMGGRTWDAPTRPEMVLLRNYVCTEYDKDCAMPCDPYDDEICDWVFGVNLGTELNNKEGFTGFVDSSWYWTKTHYGASDAWVVYLLSGIVGLGVSGIGGVVCVSRN